MQLCHTSGVYRFPLIIAEKQRNSLFYVDFKVSILLFYYSTEMGTAVAQWLRCCVLNRKVAGSIPADVIRIFR